MPEQITQKINVNISEDMPVRWQHAREWLHDEGVKPWDWIKQQVDYALNAREQEQGIDFSLSRSHFLKKQLMALKQHYTCDEIHQRLNEMTTNKRMRTDHASD